MERVNKTSNTSSLRFFRFLKSNLEWEAHPHPDYVKSSRWARTNGGTSRQSCKPSDSAISVSILWIEPKVRPRREASSFTVNSSGLETHFKMSRRSER